jgi:hypothetical protein
MIEVRMASHTAFLQGLALWAPRIPGWSVAAPILRGDREAPFEVAPRPDSVSIALEVAARACESAGVRPSELTSVFATTHGDLVINHYMSETLVGTPTLMSPTRFHNSVLNAAAGYWTIGCGCRESYTALSASIDSFGEGLLEALVQSEASGKPTLLVAYDIEACGPLAAMQPSRGIVGAGLVLSPEPGPATIARIRWRTMRGTERTLPQARNEELVFGNAMASCLPFFEAIAIARPSILHVGLSPTCLLELELNFQRRCDGSRS